MYGREELLKMKNKDFIFSCLKMLNNANALTEHNMKILCNKSICNTKFNCQYSILTEVPFYDEIKREYYEDNAGHRRYYPEKYIIGNRAYLVTNDWYYQNKAGRDNRTDFVRWVLKETN